MSPVVPVTRTVSSSSPGTNDSRWGRGVLRGSGFGSSSGTSLRPPFSSCSISDGGTPKSPEGTTHPRGPYGRDFNPPGPSLIHRHDWEQKPGGGDLESGPLGSILLPHTPHRSFLHSPNPPHPLGEGTDWTGGDPGGSPPSSPSPVSLTLPPPDPAPRQHSDPRRGLGHGRTGDVPPL